MPSKQKVGIKEKVELVKQCLNGNCSINEAAKAAGVSFATIKSWITKYETEGIDGFFWK